MTKMSVCFAALAVAAFALVSQVGPAAAGSRGFNPAGMFGMPLPSASPSMFPAMGGMPPSMGMPPAAMRSMLPRISRRMIAKQAPKVLKSLVAAAIARAMSQAMAGGMPQGGPMGPQGAMPPAMLQGMFGAGE